MGVTLVAAAIGGVLFYISWRYAHSRIMSPRVMPVLAGITAFFLAFGIPPLLYAATGMAAGDTGMGVLLVLDIVGAGVLFFEVVLAHKYHPVMTPLLGGMAGFVFAATYADWPHVRSYIATSPHKLAKAMQHEVHHVQHAHPASGTAAHQQHTYLVVFVLAVLVITFLARRAHSRRPTGQQPALPQPALQGGLGVGKFFTKLRGSRGTRGTFGTERRASVDAGRRNDALPAGRG